MTPRYGVLAAVIAVAACATARGGGAPVCVPVTGSLPSGTSLAPLQGRFIITLVADAGPRRGQTAAGYVTLRNAPAGTPGPGANARTVLVGVTDVGLEIVGALRLGDTGSEDARAPGVAVYEQRTQSALTVNARIGSLITTPPTPGERAIEGSYTVLYVRHIAAGGFAGGWASAEGGTMGNEARGHFCAVRVRD